MMIPNIWNIKIMFQTANQFSRFSQVFPHDSKNSPGFFLDVPKISPDVHHFSKFFPRFPDFLITFLGVSQDFLKCFSSLVMPEFPSQFPSMFIMLFQDVHHMFPTFSPGVPHIFRMFFQDFPPGAPNILQFFHFFSQPFPFPIFFSTFSSHFPSVSNLFPRFSLGFPSIFQLFPTFSLHFPPPLAPNRPPTARTLASSANLVKARRLKPPKAPWRCAVSITWRHGMKFMVVSWQLPSEKMNILWWFNGISMENPDD